MSAKNIARKIIKVILKTLVRITLEKHQPDIVAISGTGQTAIAREAIYAVLKQEFATRRNLETPEAEFSLPLTILGVPFYPNTPLQWLQLLVITLLQTAFTKSYSHKLVLEISDNKPALANEWLSIIKPAVFIACEGLSEQIKTGESKKFEIYKQEKDFLKPYLKTAKEVGKFFGLRPKKIEETLVNFRPPQSKINFVVSKSGLLIDASYYYLPVSLKSVFEIAEKIGRNRLFITDRQEEVNQIKSSRNQVLLIKDGEMPNLTLPHNTVVVVRVKRPLAARIIEHLTGRVIS